MDVRSLEADPLNIAYKIISRLDRYQYDEFEERIEKIKKKYKEEEARIDKMVSTDLKIRKLD